MKHVAWILLWGALARPARAQDKHQTLEPGAVAPDFTLPGVDGKQYSLKDFAGSKWLLIMFTCNHCPTAIAYEGRIKKLVDDYKEKGVTLVAINPNSPAGLRLDELGYTDLGDTLEEMKLRAQDRKFNFVYLHDGDTQEVSKKYGPQATPHAFLFDPDRRLRYVGRIDDEEHESQVKVQDLRNALDALLVGKEPPVAKTKPAGCSTKWAEKSDSVKRYMDRLAAEPVTLENGESDPAPSLLKNEGAKLRLIYVWSTANESSTRQFAELVTMNRMYRNRKFEFISVCTDPPGKREEALALLKKEQASNRNVMSQGAGGPPLTILVAPGGETVFRKEGLMDPLEVRRTIVRALGPR
jgi:peroxiredoxin